MGEAHLLEANPLKVLVAEDSRVIRGLLDRALSKRGYNVVAVEDGEAALWQLRNYQFDVALLDFHLPKLDGLQVASTLISEGKNTQVPYFVALTSDVKGLMSHSDDRNVFDLALAKPIDLVRLCEVIESLPFMASRPRGGEQVSGDAGRRTSQRTTVDRGMTRMIVDSGPSFDCKVLDLSVGGAAVQVAARLPIGQKVRLGRTEGRVVRHIPSGLAIEFTPRVMKAV
jgi:CheY-like chemotaxis protein